MRKLKNKIIQYLIKKAKKSKLVQSAFEAPVSESSFTKSGIFLDSKGNEHTLYKEIRNYVKPGADKTAETMKKERVYTEDDLSKMVADSRLLVDRLIPYIETFGQKVSGSSILEVGCHSGVVSYGLAEKGALVTGSEFSGYKVESTKMNDVNQGNLLSVNKKLEELRARVEKKFAIENKVQFVDDDICNTSLPGNSFDITVSWDVLEHLHEPQKAMKSIHHVLRKGGISINEYNSFFSLNGGHSLCTLDFFWGHVRLSEGDFLRYIHEIRPSEEEFAKSFYLKGLNRMSIKDLEHYASQVGLKVLALFTHTKEQHARMLNSNILNQCGQNYPNITAIDLCTPKIIVVFQKT